MGTLLRSLSADDRGRTNRGGPGGGGGQSPRAKDISSSDRDLGTPGTLKMGLLTDVVPFLIISLFLIHFALVALFLDGLKAWSPNSEVIYPDLLTVPPLRVFGDNS